MSECSEGKRNRVRNLVGHTNCSAMKRTQKANVTINRSAIGKYRKIFERHIQLVEQLLSRKRTGL